MWKYKEYTVKLKSGYSVMAHYLLLASDHDLPFYFHAFVGELSPWRMAIMIYWRRYTKVKGALKRETVSWKLGVTRQWRTCLCLTPIGLWIWSSRKETVCDQLFLIKFVLLVPYVLHHVYYFINFAIPIFRRISRKRFVMSIIYPLSQYFARAMWYSSIEVYNLSELPLPAVY